MRKTTSMGRQQERNFAIFAACELGKRSQRDVAQEFKISQPRVSAILRQMREFMAYAAPNAFDGMPAVARANYAIRYRRMELDWFLKEAIGEWQRSKSAIHTAKTIEGPQGMTIERVAKEQIGKIQILREANHLSKDLCDIEQLLALVPTDAPYDKRHLYDGRWKDLAREAEEIANKKQPPLPGQRDWETGKDGAIHYGWWWEKDVDQAAAARRHEFLATDKEKFHTLAGPPPIGFRGMWPAGYGPGGGPLDAEGRPMDSSYSHLGGCGREYRKIWGIPEMEVAVPGAKEEGLRGEGAKGQEMESAGPPAALGLESVGEELEVEHAADALPCRVAANMGAANSAPKTVARTAKLPTPREVDHLPVEEKIKRIPTPMLQPYRTLLRYGIVRDRWGNFRDVSDDTDFPPNSVLSLDWKYLTPEEREQRRKIEEAEALMAGLPYPPNHETIVLRDW